jgi:hypothetical protein
MPRPEQHKTGARQSHEHSRLARDCSRQAQDWLKTAQGTPKNRAKSVQEPPTQPKTAEETGQTSQRQAKRALGAPEDSTRWVRDTHKTSSSEGQELLGLPGMAPPEWIGVDLDTLGRRKRITRELAWIKRIASELPWWAGTCLHLPTSAF